MPGSCDADGRANPRLSRGLPRCPSPTREGEFVVPVEEVGEELVGQVAAAVDLLLLFAQAVVDEQALVRAVVVQLVEHVLDLAAGDVDAEVIAGDGFDRVGFVEDHDVVVGQDAHAGPAQGDVAEQQRVIDDQDLRVSARGGGPCSRSTGCTSGSGGPCSCRCRWRLRPTPGRAAGTARSLSEPSAVDLLHLRILRSCSSCSSSLNRLWLRASAEIEPPQAEVVAAALSRARPRTRAGSPR